jgi:hypothetical protein
MGYWQWAIGDEFKAGDRLFSNKNTGFASPIKIIKNQRINI